MRREPLAVIEHSILPSRSPSGAVEITARVSVDGMTRTIAGIGNGPIDAFVNALARECDIALTIDDYHEHAIHHGSDALAAAYISVRVPGRPSLFGVGIHANIVSASLAAAASALNRAVGVGAIRRATVVV
jgi:2-isopropylmalate synthase